LFLCLVSMACLCGCLPDERDPDKATSDAGNLSNATYYAAALGNIGVRLQSEVVGNATWFETLGSSQQLDLAAMGIVPSGLPAAVRSVICPTGTGSEVLQLTWLDGRNATGGFAIKGLGDTGKGGLVKELIKRGSASQVGIYDAAGAIYLSDGHVKAIPPSCADLSFPSGAPMLVFTISRPAAPTQEMARTEYRTSPCPTGEVGTMVEKRIVRFLPNGSIQPSDRSEGWVTENMGHCTADVAVTTNKTDIVDGGASIIDAANMEHNQLTDALRDVLTANLRMNCSQTTIGSEKNAVSGSQATAGDTMVRTSKTIDTCAKVSMAAQGAADEVDMGPKSDTRTMVCGHATKNANYLSTLPGVSNIVRTDGTVTATRVLDSKLVDHQQLGQREFWLGEEISCKWDEKFDVNCGIPGTQPALEPQHSTQKWITHDLAGWFFHESWFDSIFASCFWDCTDVESASWEGLNPDYFTGTKMYADSGTQTDRAIDANGWLDKKMFVPSVSSSLWSLSKNECTWGQMNMMEDCPQSVDPALVTDRDPTITTTDTTALRPGVAAGGDSGLVYQSLLAQNQYVSNVTLNWEHKYWDICTTGGWFPIPYPCKKTDRWAERAGPGRDVYIKAWDQNGPSAIDPSKTAKITTVLYNRDGLVQTWKPQLFSFSYFLNNGFRMCGFSSCPSRYYTVQNLSVQQAGYLQPLMCGRHETREIGTGLGLTTAWCSFPIFAASCMGPVTASSVQEYIGTAPGTGTWSKAKTTYKVCNLKGCVETDKLTDIQGFSPN